MYLTKEDAECFVGAVARVTGEEDLRGFGLCYLLAYTYIYCVADVAYDVIKELFPDLHHSTEGFGGSGWTPQRYTLLALLKALSVDDILEICNQEERS